ncbi:class I tRNA ligase family protein [Streptomyces sp. ISL-99]|uniref:class I tRNA ligase family protein n=1 Tax=Streptomyces sp. ISL-99 TaxID=2819193 RepID=UPI001BEAD20D|nr:class I tRNA ligase family protein [Streptomyces sp. ISL-99]MBT2525907.1 class I tRNA ligase family protein [Streptomyces sp. ISL-99]
MNTKLGADSRPPRNYLLTLPEPTPNGPFHLGHIAGPYLRMDVIARFLRCRGDRPVVVSGSDVYDPWVPLKAGEEGTTPREVSARYHARISSDLSDLAITTDAFINVSEEPWRDRFEREVDHSLAHLRGRGAVVERTERVLYSESARRHVVGAWLLGRCPDCGAGTASYFCEECGAHFLPENVVEPRSRNDDDGPLAWREIDSLFLALPDAERLDARLARMSVPERYRATVRRFLAREGLAVRLSAPQEWAVDLGRTEPQVPRGLFSYTGTFMFTRLAGEIHGMLTGTGVNAFAPESDVVTLTSLGIDNVIPVLVGIVGTSLMYEDMRTYDRCLITDFHQLAGEKFSTSRRHAIWVADIARARNVSVDAVRYFLAKVNPEAGPASFEPAEFLAEAGDRLSGRFGASLAACHRRLPERPGAPDGRLMARLDALLGDQERALDSPQVSTAAAVRAFDTWCDSAPGPDAHPDTAYWWLKGAAVLGWPVMPGFAQQTWTTLGGDGEPRLSAFLHPTAPVTAGGPVVFPRPTAADLAPCLPETLGSPVSPVS